MRSTRHQSNMLNHMESIGDYTFNNLIFLPTKGHFTAYQVHDLLRPQLFDGLYFSLGVLLVSYLT